MTYNQQGIISNQDKVIQHLPLVRKIANSIYRRINFSMDLDDLIQSGTIGLLDAIQKYKPVSGANFETYASTRINGSIIDELRKNDPLNQEERATYKKIQLTIKKLQQTQTHFSEQEIANKCNITLDEYFDVIYKNQLFDVVSSEDFSQEYESVVDEKISPEKNAQNNEVSIQLQQAIKKLSDKEQLVMQLMYIEELNATEAGLALNISKARVSQIHSNSILKLQSILKPKFN